MGLMKVVTGSSRLRDVYAALEGHFCVTLESDDVCATFESDDVVQLWRIGGFTSVSVQLWTVMSLCSFGQ